MVLSKQEVILMILKLSFILSLFSCSEPSQTSLVSQSRINAGPYVRSEKTFVLPVTGETIVQIQGSTQKDLDDLNNVVSEAVMFVSNHVASLIDDQPCRKGLINVHIISDDKLNDRSVMTFTKDRMPGKEFYGITTYIYPDIAWSFICSDCDESADDIFVHELTHFYMAQCGIPPESQDEDDCHDMVNAYRESKL